MMAGGIQAGRGEGLTEGGTWSCLRWSVRKSGQVLNEEVLRAGERGRLGQLEAWQEAVPGMAVLGQDPPWQGLR